MRVIMFKHKAQARVREGVTSSECPPMSKKLSVAEISAAGVSSSLDIMARIVISVLPSGACV